MQPYKTNIIPETSAEKKRRVDKVAAEKFKGRKRNDRVEEDRRLLAQAGDVWDMDKFEKMYGEV